MSKFNSPYIHTRTNSNERVADWAIAILPVFIWSIFIFGGRVAMLSAIGFVFAVGLDFPLRRYLLKYDRMLSIDLMSGIYGILAVFTMPVTVPLFAPVVSSALVVVAKNIKAVKGRRLFNPFIFSAAVMNLAFPKMMTAFTRPFAYFSAFDFVIDERLMEYYLVKSPLQYIADGSVYEDGLFAQLYGFASGNMGEIAVAAILLGFIYLVFRKEAEFSSAVGVLFPILFLALAFPSGDAEINHYAYSILLSGGIIFISAFGFSERHTLPLNSLGKTLLAVACGCLIFLFRKVAGGAEWGYLVLLGLNAASPFVEAITRPNPSKKTTSTDKKALKTNEE